MNINDQISDNCEGFILNKNTNNTSIITGDNTKYLNAIYSYQLVYNIELVKDGKITFTYKKKTIKDEKEKNGQFNFYVNYDLKLHDDEVMNETQTYSQELSKGYHSLYWQYNAWSSTEELNAEIISIIIEGTEEEIYSCQPCIGINPLCNECPENSYKHDNVYYFKIGHL
jgi:hypothetical protein